MHMFASKESISKLIFIFVLFVLILIPAKTYATTITEQGQNTITATVYGPPPPTAPTIDSPGEGQNFDVKNISVSGTCISNLIVKVFSNNLFLGSAVCLSGQYQIPIDLFIEKNNLVVRQYDSMGQPSPDSNITTVYYLPKTLVSGLAPSLQDINSSAIEANFSLYINYDYTVLGIFPDQTLRLPIDFNGGTPPYAVAVDWGDGSNNLYSRDNSETFYAEKKYEDPGLYTVKVKITDSIGDNAYKQFVVVVKGDNKSLIVSLQNNVSENRFIQLIAVPVLLGGCFYAGSVHQRRRHKKSCPEHECI